MRVAAAFLVFVIAWMIDASVSGPVVAVICWSTAAAVGAGVQVRGR